MDRDSVAVAAAPPSETAAGASAAATSLAPGFRFHPTDDELVSYYLKRKVLGQPVRFDAIGEVDIYKHEPWGLAVFSRLKTRDQEWYFFNALDKKYGKGTRMNRATNKGYWKATGKDREIRRDVQLLGTKKTLVFHSGRAPDGIRTNWVMHEYRLVEYETENKGNPVQDAYVLCRVFHKNNIGPPSGNRYAPFMEEEWVDDGGALIPGVDVRVRVEPPPLSNGNNQMDQEIQSASKSLININEPPRETAPMDNEPNQHNHHETALKPLEHNNNSDYNDEEALKREHTEEDERPLPLCVLNKEAPLPPLQYKRKRQNESTNNNSSRNTQDHCSSTTKTVDNTTTLISSSAAATNTTTSALLELSLTGTSDKKENQQKLLRPHKEASPLTPLATPEEKVNELRKEVHQMSVERETFKLEMMSAEALISILESRIDALHLEKEELKKKSGNGQ